MQEWVNWSGSLRFVPNAYVEPRDEGELREIVRSNYETGRKVKLAAAGHSSSPLVETKDTLVHMGQFKALVRTSEADQTATFRAGTTVHEANKELQKLGLALFNTGDVDVQTLAGAISTGTHGTGRQLQNLSSMLHCARLINCKGDVKVISASNHPDLIKALRVSLGALGFFSEVTVKIKPLFKLRRLEICVDADACMSHFDQLADENRNVDFYWYPRSDETKIRILNEPDEGSKSFSFPFKCKEEEVGWVGEVLPKERELKFDEMEYAFHRDAGMECFKAIRKRIKERHRKDVAWRVLYRTIAADENYLSPHYKRDSVTISLHHNAGLSYEEYFSDIEPVFVDFGGRPHWAKKHSMKASQLKSLYPEWNKFQSIRKAMDPDGFFMNRHLKELFEDED